MTMADSTLFGLPVDQVANTLGMVATICFIIQYIPQMVLNSTRKSMYGFSFHGILIKHLGACFLFVNTFVTAEADPVVIYGLFNVLQHTVFIIQFQLYQNVTEKPRLYLPWLWLPFLPAIAAFYAPASLPYTSSVKPACQLLSHVPQLLEVVRCRTAAGTSMATQHLNFVGGMAGLIMCYLVPPVSIMTTLMYVNSCMQAITLYYAAIYFDVLRIGSSSSSSPSAASASSPARCKAVLVDPR
eukprot:TRINITY_DN5882_c0_g1_i3.p1 TRINITY_DN5882_c0_g1~~TRINITY_DN5882_c0_g1_i3.p1  ORF type:complete len:242 (+),score=61.98 TRINITY_DN5882_c0_g1_i3:326-1051(+)